MIWHPVYNESSEDELVTMLEERAKHVSRTMSNELFYYSMLEQILVTLRSHHNRDMLLGVHGEVAQISSIVGLFEFIDEKFTKLNEYDDNKSRTFLDSLRGLCWDERGEENVSKDSER